MTEIYVGGLPNAMTESQLTSLFAPHGTVESTRVISDWFTGKPLGFGFVEMATSEEAAAAISALNGTQMDGCSLIVNEVEPRSGRRRSTDSAAASASKSFRDAEPFLSGSPVIDRSNRHPNA